MRSYSALIASASEKGTVGSSVPCTMLMGGSFATEASARRHRLEGTDNARTAPVTSMMVRMLEACSRCVPASVGSSAPPTSLTQSSSLVTPRARAINEPRGATDGGDVIGVHRVLVSLGADPADRCFGVAACRIEGVPLVALSFVRALGDLGRVGRHRPKVRCDAIVDRERTHPASQRRSPCGRTSRFLCDPPMKLPP